jgi:hypothetical protein
MQNRNDHAISKALEAWGGSFDRIGPGQWGLALPGAQNRTFSARLEGSWLVIEEPPNAEGECMAVEQVDMWNYLGRNAGLAGNAKFTICEDGSIQVRAEIPLEGIPSEVVSLRIAEAVKGLIEAFQKPLEQSASIRPCDNGGGDNMTLAHLCAEAGWPFIEREGDRLQVDLGPTDFPQAVIERRPSGIAMRANFIAEEGAYPEDDRGNALGILLLRACRSLRLARAVACQESPRRNVGFEVIFAGTPHPREVGQGLAALAVACDLTWREVKALAKDAGLARAYLRACSRRAARVGSPRSEPYKRD